MKQHTTLTVKPWVYRSIRSLMIQLVAIGVFFTVSAIIAEIRDAAKDQKIGEAYKADPFAGESEYSLYLRDQDAQMEREYPNGIIFTKSDTW